MQVNNFAAYFIVTSLCLSSFGCSRRDAPPLTPSENSATPTYRSTTNSWELDSAPKYTQSGINGGEPATVPAIPEHIGFSENTALASSVFTALKADPKIYNRYISVYSEGSTIRLLGTANKANIAQIESDVKSVPGVKKLQNKLEAK